jgi:hypothetical protein
MSLAQVQVRVTYAHQESSKQEEPMVRTLMNVKIAKLVQLENTVSAAAVVLRAPVSTVMRVSLRRPREPSLLNVSLYRRATRESTDLAITSTARALASLVHSAHTKITQDFIQMVVKRNQNVQWALMWQIPIL